MSTYSQRMEYNWRDKTLKWLQLLCLVGMIVGTFVRPEDAIIGFLVFQIWLMFRENKRLQRAALMYQMDLRSEIRDLERQVAWLNR